MKVFTFQAAGFDAYPVGRDERRLIVPSDLLVDGIECTTRYREHHVQAMIVREREIFAVLRRALPRESQSGDAVLDTAADVVHILRRVQQRRVVAADPSVHYEGSTVGVVDPAEHCVGLGL